jgi:hypothetical protein
VSTITDPPREARLRRRAARQGFVLRKSRGRMRHMNDIGGYRVVDANRTTLIVAGERFDMSLADVEQFLSQVAVGTACRTHRRRSRRGLMIASPVVSVRKMLVAPSAWSCVRTSGRVRRGLGAADWRAAHRPFETVRRLEATVQHFPIDRRAHRR